MKRILMVAVAALALAFPQLARAASEQQTVDDAAVVVQHLNSNTGLAPAARDALRRSHGVMIIPALVKGGFIFGAQGGTGVLLSRDPQTGSWSYPAFYATGAGSFGRQIGLEVSKIMLIIMNDKAMNAMMAAEFKLGAEAGIAVATLGGGAEASTTAAGGADIYALAESAGLFGGVAIQGGIIKPLVDEDHRYYNANLTAQQIVLARVKAAKNPGADVGKSLLTAGLARTFARRGLSVRPFKPQNMSNNAAVTADGGEIGRAQALQARASGVAPSVHMNPVLLKPQSERGAQVVVAGRMLRSASAREYQTLRADLLPRVLQSFELVAAGADLVLVEGAGSPAEVNLRAGDIANMGFAEAADVPVVLVGDIERGGVLAQICGTHLLLSPAERQRLKGVIVNKFRGDVSLFAGGIETIRSVTGLACLGVVPWFERAHELH